MSGSQIALASLVGAAGFTVAIIALVMHRLRRHDPARALASARVAADGSFRLALPEGRAVDVYLRFETDAADTDFVSLSVGVELLLAGGRVERAELHTLDAAPALGFAAPARVDALTAVSSGDASFLLFSLAAGAATEVSGVVRAGEPPRLLRADVYALAG